MPTISETYLDLVKEAIVSLKERGGSSRPAIHKFVAAKKGPAYRRDLVNGALKRGVEKGELIQVKSSFKIARPAKKAPAKKAPAKKAPAKKAPAKKAAPKKKAPAKKAAPKKKAPAKKNGDGGE
jgi:topoisomerase IA-like protein